MIYAVSIGLLATFIPTSDLRCSSQCLDALIGTVCLGITVRWQYKHQQGYQPVQDVNCEMCVCPYCGNAFKGTGGLNVHCCVCHPDVYHAARQLAARVKARWSYEEMILIACAELQVCRAKPPGGILRVLQSRFPDQTLKAIKCL